MIVRSDFHIHTCFCDGVDTPEDIVKAAIKQDFNALGFSGHSYTDFDEEYCMNKEKTKEYIDEITRLKSKYLPDINIFLGLEKDYFSQELNCPFDYIIGSVHYVLKDGHYLAIDESATSVSDSVQTFYGGNYYRYAEDYYTLVADIVQKTDADIIGHFDLLTKFNEGGKYFDESDHRYTAPALKALEVLVKTGRLFEINTGAISRGYKATPYPSAFLLKALRDKGGEIIFSSDSHSQKTLGFGFDSAVRLAKDCGFSHSKVLTRNGFRSVSI